MLFLAMVPFADHKLVILGKCRRELYGRAPLGPWLCRLDGRVRTGADPPIHPRPRASGWMGRAVLEHMRQRRALATPKPPGQPPLRRPYSLSHLLCGGSLTRPVHPAQEWIGAYLKVISCHRWRRHPEPAERATMKVKVSADTLPGSAECTRDWTETKNS